VIDEKYLAQIIDSKLVPATQVRYVSEPGKGYTASKEQQNWQQGAMCPRQSSLMQRTVDEIGDAGIGNPCVGGSIPPRATKNIFHATPTHAGWRFGFRARNAKVGLPCIV
jgi:hypothetical protein